MGSGTDRKKNDAPIVQRPLKNIIADLGGGGSKSGYAAPEQCLASFDRAVKATPLTKPGVKVNLQEIGNQISICIGSDRIGLLTSQQAKMVKECGKLGVRYRGEIVSSKSRTYARFIRIHR